MMHEPFFSIVLPTRNRRKLLARAVTSVLGQDIRDFELLVVDDASTDGTCRWLHEIDDSRLIILSRNQPGGPSGARNVALRRARGIWITFLDDDDEFLPGMLTAVKGVLERSPAAIGFLWCGIEKVRDQDAGWTTVKRLIWEAPETYYRYPRDLLHLGAATGYGLTVQRAAVEAVGPFDEHLQAGVDFDWLLRLGLHYPYTVVPSVQVRVHLHSTRQVTDPSIAKAESFDHLLGKRHDFLSRHPNVLRTVLHKTASLYYQLGKRERGRLHLLRMIRNEPHRLAGWKSLLFLELFGTEQLGLRRKLRQWTRFGSGYRAR